MTHCGNLRASFCVFNASNLGNALRLSLFYPSIQFSNLLTIWRFIDAPLPILSAHDYRFYFVLEIVRTYTVGWEKARGLSSSLKHFLSCDHARSQKSISFHRGTHPAAYSKYSDQNAEHDLYVDRKDVDKYRIRFQGGRSNWRWFFLAASQPATPAGFSNLEACATYDGWFAISLPSLYK